MIDKLAQLDARFLIAVARNPAIDRAIAALDPHDWAPIGYTDDGEAHVAETSLTSARRPVIHPGFCAGCLLWIPVLVWSVVAAA